MAAARSRRGRQTADVEAAEPEIRTTQTQTQTQTQMQTQTRKRRIRQTRRGERHHISKEGLQV